MRLVKVLGGGGSVLTPSWRTASAEVKEAFTAANAVAWREITRADAAPWKAATAGDAVASAHMYALPGTGSGGTTKPSPATDRTRPRA